MIINLASKDCRVHLDFKLNEIRIVKSGIIYFMKLSSADVAGYAYLYNSDIKEFKRVLFEEVKLNLDINLKGLEVLK